MFSLFYTCDLLYFLAYYNTFAKKEKCTVIICSPLLKDAVCFSGRLLRLLQDRAAQKVDCDLPVDHQGCAGRPHDMPPKYIIYISLKYKNNMSLDIKKGLSASFMASKVGKPPMQCFVQESVALQRAQKPTSSIQNGMNTFPPSISHLFPPYSKCVCLICNASTSIPKPPSSPQVKHLGWVQIMLRYSV